jgi:hypothetical protein
LSTQHSEGHCLRTSLGTRRSCMPEAPPLDRTVVEADSFLFQRRLTRNTPKESEALEALGLCKNQDLCLRIPLYSQRMMHLLRGEHKGSSVIGKQKSTQVICEECGPKLLKFFSVIFIGMVSTSR